MALFLCINKRNISKHKKMRMKLFIFSLLFSLVLLSCEKDFPGISDLSDQIILTTDKVLYLETDSLNLFLENTSGLDIITGLRCGEYLEMSYQLKEKGHWSADKYFWFMKLGCPTFPDTIQSKNIFTYSISCTQFDTVGTFRLLVPYYVPEKDTSMVVISNSFEIK